MRRLGLPKEEDWEQQEPNNQRHIDMNLIPALGICVGQSEWHQKTTKCRDDQDNADYIELPEQSNDELEWSKHLVWSTVVGQIFMLLCSSVSHKEGKQQGNG